MNSHLEGYKTSLLGHCATVPVYLTERRKKNKKMGNIPFTKKKHTEQDA